METLGSQVSSGQRTSHKRVQHIIGLPKQGRRRERMVPLNTTDPALNAGLPKYGLGTVRSLWQWWQFAKLDPIVQNKQTFTDHWCTTYGPRTGKPDDNWKEFAKENDVPAEEWWHKGVAILAVPQDHPSLAKYPAFCTDQLTECSDLVAEGKCSTDKSVRRLCALSCSACEVPRIEQAGEAGVR
ncbi:glycosyltransferase (GlcNAc) [Diplonema papillatum]|nr:glycosyltransferase (GlcNAc) [Diplonema papillatum]